MIKVFIGYDTKEKAAFTTLSHSIIQNSTKPVSITPIALSNLKDDFDTPDGFAWPTQPS